VQKVNKAKMTFRFDTVKPVLDQPTRPMEQTTQPVNKLRNIVELGHEQVHHEPKQVEAQDERKQVQDHEQQYKQEYEQVHGQLHDEVYEESNSTQHERVTYQPIDTSNWGDPFVDHVDLGGGIYPVGAPPGVEQLETSSSQYNYRKRTTNWWKLSGSIAGAVMTGVLFGAVVLAVFNQDITMPVPTGGVPSQSDPTTSVSSTTPNPNESSTSIPPVGIKLPDKTYYFLQYGVFSTAQGVQLAQEELRASGIAAARDTVDEKRVYAGVSSEREQAKLLGNELKTKGVNLIIHEVVFPRAAVVPFQGEAALLENYVESSVAIVDLLSTASADRLQQAKAKALDEAELKALQKAHQEWIASATGIQGKLAGKQLEAVTVMDKSIHSAVEAMSEFNKKGAKPLLWEVQNELMKFILAEQHMLSSTQ
jgi:stage II sporulation protein B